MFKRSVVVTFWIVLVLVFLVAVQAYRDRQYYSITAYSNHPISINKKKWRDFRFASYRKTYFGGVAADPSIPFGTKVELIPQTPAQERAINKYLAGQRKFTVEDRGYLVKGKVIDIFIPRRLGGHKTARRWGRQRMKVELTFPDDKK